MVIFRNQFETREKEPIEGIEFPEGETTEEVALFPSKFDLVWFCPGPEQGPAVFKFSFRFRNVDAWQTLKITLKD
jgi:hypothetical protein